ncbi:MAG TPA: hypothetical protein VGR35_20210 [Tepidisphaeraceae bacterium]|nr:hypothetical protein [Tepidisphaeraceae bacterium]
MKKVVRSSTGTSPTIQAAPAGNVNSIPSRAKLQQRASTSTSPTPVWSRYVDSRLKQFCLR